jgi:hypothetical protein
MTTRIYTTMAGYFRRTFCLKLDDLYGDTEREP